jgi:hypothetical protein
MDIFLRFDPLYLKFLVTGSFMAVYTIACFLSGTPWKKTVTSLLLTLVWLTQSTIVYSQTVDLGVIILAGIGLGLCADFDPVWSWGTLAIQLAIPLLVAFLLSWFSSSVVALENDVLLVLAVLTPVSLVTLGFNNLIGHLRHRPKRIF